jgi:hypothetical protein
MRGSVPVLVAALVAAGCAAASKDGPGHAASPPVAPNAAPEILVVGRAGPLRPVSDARRENAAGSVSIETPGGVLGRHDRTPALLRAVPAQETPLARGDLVAARGDGDGPVWIDRVLCRSGPAFAACAEKYQTGLFDGDSGREIDRQRKRKPDGEWIDVTSYLRLSKDPQRHKASELDPRAVNRCDDCKGSVPGSVQATVPPPQLD